MGTIVIGNNKIQEGDFIIDTEKIGVSINGKTIEGIVKCVKIIDDENLIWESMDGKSSACDSIFQFKKVVEF